MVLWERFVTDFLVKFGGAYAHSMGVYAPSAAHMLKLLNCSMVIQLSIFIILMSKYNIIGPKLPFTFLLTNGKPQDSLDYWQISALLANGVVGHKIQRWNIGWGAVRYFVLSVACT